MGNICQKLYPICFKKQYDGEEPLIRNNTVSNALIDLCAENKPPIIDEKVLELHTPPETDNLKTPPSPSNPPPIPPLPLAYQVNEYLTEETLPKFTNKTPENMIKPKSQYLYADL